MLRVTIYSLYYVQLALAVLNWSVKYITRHLYKNLKWLTCKHPGVSPPALICSQALSSTIFIIIENKY